jgi:DNA-binding CsgD family transcriptional regulator
MPMGQASATTAPGFVLVEREGELAALREMIDDAAASSARLAVVEGPAGIGKSRLLAALRTEADASGFRVLAARGSDFERAFPFGVVRQLFEPLVAAGSGDITLTGAAEAAAPVFRAPAEEAAPSDASFGVLHGLYWLTLNLTAERPLALVVDDLHWADVPSLRFLAYLAHRLEGQPVLLAVGLRSAEPGADPALLAEIASGVLSTYVRPSPLSLAAVSELVTERLGEPPAPAFADACHEATGGNPLLLHELLKTLAAEEIVPSADAAGSMAELGSRAIARSVLLRLARLSEDAVDVARSVAVLGEGADVAAVAGLAEIDERRVAAATRDLTRAEILRPDLQLGFVHPLVRDAVYHDLAAGERELMHARAVAVLRELGAPIERLAAHWLILPRRGDRAVGAALREAGRLATRQGAPDSAVAYLQRALAEPLDDDERMHVLLELGLVGAELKIHDAIDDLRAAHEGLTDPAERALAAEALARQLCFASTGEEAAAVARTALAELPPDLDEQRHRLQAAELLAVHFGAAAPDLEDRLERLRRGIRGDGAGAWMLDAIVTMNAAYLCHPQTECVPHALAAIEGGVVAADPTVGALAAIIVLVLAEQPEALELWEQLRAVAYRRGSLFAIIGLQLWRGFTLLTFGEIAEAGESLRQAAENEVSWARDSGAAIIYTSSFRARVLLEQGDVAGAQRSLERRGVSEAGSDGWLFAALAEAEIQLASGDHAGALEVLDRAQPHLWRVDNPAWLPWRTVAARALAGLGRGDEALALLDEDLERARRWGAPAPIGRALRVRAELGGGDEAGLREAVDVLSGSVCRLEHAKALAALGRTIRLSRRPAEAREPLMRALEIAESCGATAFADAVRSELYAAGARPRSAATTGIGSLTASELRVAKLAAEGRTNREIAQALYVTPKTVEVHLSSTYRKLGIRSRTTLATALA